jgi:hypothetical protein
MGRTLSFCASAIRLFAQKSATGGDKKGPATNSFSIHSLNVVVKIFPYSNIDGAFDNAIGFRYLAWYAGAPRSRKLIAAFAPRLWCTVQIPDAPAHNPFKIGTFTLVLGFTGSGRDGYRLQNLLPGSAV